LAIFIDGVKSGLAIPTNKQKEVQKKKLG